MNQLNVQQINQNFLETKYQSAVKIPAEQWDSIIYADGIGDEYFLDWDALMEYLEFYKCDEDNSDESIPVYVFATVKITLQCDSILDLVESHIEDFYDDAYDDLKMYYATEIDEVNQALTKFCQQLEKQGFGSYRPDYSKVILPPEVMLNTTKQKDS